MFIFNCIIVAQDYSDSIIEKEIVIAIETTNGGRLGFTTDGIDGIIRDMVCIEYDSNLLNSYSKGVYSFYGNYSLSTCTLSNSEKIRNQLKEKVAPFQMGNVLVVYNPNFVSDTKVNSDGLFFYRVFKAKIRYKPCGNVDLLVPNFGIIENDSEKFILINTKYNVLLEIIECEPFLNFNRYISISPNRLNAIKKKKLN